MGTPNKGAVADRARNIYLFIAAGGWSGAFAEYRPEMAAMKPKRACATDLLAGRLNALTPVKRLGTAVSAVLAAVPSVLPETHAKRTFELFHRVLIRNVTGRCNQVVKFPA